MTKQLGLVFLCLAGLCSLVAGRQAAAAGFPPQGLTFETPKSCARAAVGAVVPEAGQDAEDAVVLYALPRALCRAGAGVSVEVSVAGELYLEESFVLPPAPTERAAAGVERAAAAKWTVFELFDRESDLRQLLLDLAARPQTQVEIAVDGVVAERVAVAALLAKSEEVKKLGILPQRVDSPASQVGLTQGAAVLPKIVECGDGNCDGFGPFFENCLNCPQDCGPYPCEQVPHCTDGLCNGNETCSSCPGDCGPCCPFALPDITNTHLIGTTTLGSACYLDVYNGAQTVEYVYTQYDYKLKTFSRVQECDGSITKTLISITYFSENCYVRTSIGCYPGYGYPAGCVIY